MCICIGNHASTRRDQNTAHGPLCEENPFESFSPLGVPPKERNPSKNAIRVTDTLKVIRMICET